MGSTSWSQIEARARFLWNDLCTEFNNRDWRAPPKPFSQFTERFTRPPTDPKALANRLLLNSHIYQTNYCLILGAALLYYVLIRPSSLFVVGSIIVAWVAATSPRPLVVSGRRLTRKERFSAVTAFSVLALVLSGVLIPFLNVFGLAVSLILVHAAFRHTSLRHKVSDLHTANRW